MEAMETEIPESQDIGISDLNVMEHVEQLHQSYFTESAEIKTIVDSLITSINDL